MVPSPLRPLLAALCAFAASTASAEDGGIDMMFVEGPPPASHPTVLVGYLKDHPYTVVAVKNNIGVVDRDGKQERLSSSAHYGAVRDNAFAPGSVEIRTQESTSSQTNLVYHFANGSNVSGGTVTESSSYKATVVATRDCADCFVALIFFNTDYLRERTDDPGFILALDHVGTLRAGVETKIDLRYGYLVKGSQERLYLPLFFTKGREIRTNYAEALARLFRRVDLIRHEKILADFRARNPDATLEASPYMRFPPLFPEGTNLAALPENVRIDYTVTEDGTVEGVVPQNGLPDEVARAFVRTFEGWLYYPKLVNGLPRRSFHAASFPLGAMAKAAVPGP